MLILLEAQSFFDNLQNWVMADWNVTKSVSVLYLLCLVNI